ncbi:MAG: glycoside hydrolase family 3 C-terminal domain-containing protein [Bacteroidia bacterium]|nr:glycoside hydrolase family 3 C-terminal domain-containing protein [Bacteroidia bacterium]
MLSTRVKSLLDSLSLEEKVGQMAQLTINVILEEGSFTEASLEKIRFAIKEKKIGSMLNVLVHAYDLPTWDGILSKLNAVTKETEHQIPILYGIDSIHGANYTQDSTLFPHNIGLAASRNDELVAKGARVSALETRASGIRWTFDPVLDVGRQPLWSRFEETFGEDTYLCGRMGGVTIRAYEGDDLSSPQNVASCMKHFLGYSHPASGKDRTPAYIPEIQLREIFLPPFAHAISLGSSTIMINSGEINGTPVHGNKYLLTDVLRDELGFEGLVVTDWEDIIRLHTRHKIATSIKDAIRIGINAGIDMSMTPFDFDFVTLLFELVEEGQVPISRIDEAVGRILTLKEKLGLLDNPSLEPEARANFGLNKYKEIALESARETITLLKNDEQVLPLDGPLGGYPKVILAGPCANSLAPLHGSWSFTWQGEDNSYYPSSTQTIREALEDKLGANQVLCMADDDWESPQNYLLPHSNNFDAVILCLGENAYAESPGSIDDLELDPRQIQLANKAFITGRPVIVVLCQGRPRIIRAIADQAKAIILAYRPGSQGARAIVETIFGDHNPSGILPFSYPRWSGDHIPYDHKFSAIVQEPTPGNIVFEGYKPQFPFGFGLSYTSFEFSDFKVSKQEFGPDDKIEISITVKNTGARDGNKAVELYSKDLFASVSPSQKRLRAYEKVALKAGEWKEVRFELGPEDLSFINTDLERVTEAGKFEIWIDEFLEEIEYTG